MTKGLLDMAIKLCKSGEKDTARELLQVLSSEDPHNESAWMWYAETFPTIEERIQILGEFLQQNNDNQRVLALYNSLLITGVPTDQAIDGSDWEKSIECKYCGKQISDSLLLCPYCGAIDSELAYSIQTIQRDHIPEAQPQSQIINPEDDQIDIPYQSPPAEEESEDAAELSTYSNESGSLTQPGLFSEDAHPGLTLEDNSTPPSNQPDIKTEYIQTGLFQGTRQSNKKESTSTSSSKSVDIKTVQPPSHDTKTNLAGYTDPNISPIFPTNLDRGAKQGSSTHSPMGSQPSAIKAQLPGTNNERVISYSQTQSVQPPGLDRYAGPQSKSPQTNSENKQGDIKTEPGKERKELLCPNCQSPQVEDTYEIKWGKVLLNSLLVVVTLGLWVFVLAGASILNRKTKTRYFCNSCRYGWE